MEVVQMIEMFALTVAKKDIGPMSVKKAVGRIDATNVEKGATQKKIVLAQEVFLDLQEEEGEDQAQDLDPTQGMAIVQGGRREIDTIKKEVKAGVEVRVVEVEAQREIIIEIRIRKRNIESEASLGPNQLQNLSLVPALQLRRKRKRKAIEIHLKSRSILRLL
jgi:hypothetical protein